MHMAVDVVSNWTTLDARMILGGNHAPLSKLLPPLQSLARSHPDIPTLSRNLAEWMADGDVSDHLSTLLIAPIRRLLMLIDTADVSEAGMSGFARDVVFWIKDLVRVVNDAFGGDSTSLFRNVPKLLFFNMIFRC
jgi:hypothetical protein